MTYSGIKSGGPLVHHILIDMRHPTRKAHGEPLILEQAGERLCKGLAGALSFSLLGYCTRVVDGIRTSTPVYRR